MNNIFPVIKSFKDLTTLSNISFPWIEYVILLNKRNPLFRDVNEYVNEYMYEKTEEDKKLDEKAIQCDICHLHFIPDMKDKYGNNSIYYIHGLYKHHKPVYRLFEYNVCTACFYMLQNPLIETDYPKINRKDRMPECDYKMSFVQLKRKGIFGYHGKIIIESKNNKDIYGYIPNDIAVKNEEGDLFLNEEYHR